MTDDKKEQHEKEVEAITALYILLLQSLQSGDFEDALYALAELETDITFRYVISGLGIEYDSAISLLKNKDDENLTKSDIDLRNRLIAAIDNLIDFSVCKEYQLYDETNEYISQNDFDLDEDEYEELLLLNHKYNDQYSLVEHSDIEYAGKIAALWAKISGSQYVTYWTQNDAKVRPWHMELQGYTAHAEEFPSWMIPPIEYNCRCFLEIHDGYEAKGDLKDIKGEISKITKPSQLSDVYSDSLAKCGKIFSASHPYFSIKEDDKEMLKGFVDRLKEKYYGE